MSTKIIKNDISWTSIQVKEDELRPTSSQPKGLGLDLAEEEKKKSRWKMGITLPSTSNILALLIKNWITMKRSPILLIFVFFLPGIFMVITCLTIGLEPTGLSVRDLDKLAKLRRCVSWVSFGLQQSLALL